MPVTNIVEAKEVIRTFKLKYKYDLNIFSLTSLRYKIDKTISLHYLRYADVLCARINEDSEFRDEFLYDISTPSTEMFRDPEFWKTLMKHILPELTGKNTPSVWLPGTTAGNDLYSLLIILNSSGLYDKCLLHASSCSQKSLELINSGWFDNRHLEQSLDNFHKVLPGENFKKYLEFKNHSFYRLAEPLKDVRFSIHDMHFKPAPARVNLILFRNKLIYFTREFQNRILDFFTEVLEPGGFLITGYQENVDRYISDKPGMTIYNKEERIFRKVHS